MKKPPLPSIESISSLAWWSDVFVSEHADTLCSVVTGAVTFGSTLALSTWTQWRILGIQTGTPGPAPSVVGMASVCLASWACHQAALFTLYSRDHIRSSSSYQDDHTIGISNQLRSSWASWRQEQQRVSMSYDRRHRDDQVDAKYFRLPMHTIRVCAIGALAFKLMGGRFWAISPSSYANIGSFARQSLPATERYATAAERLKLDRIGRMWGCHTCGSRSRSFVGDHMPPKSVAEAMMKRRKLFFLRPKAVNFRFYPQCEKCSSQQGSILSRATQQLRLSRKRGFQLHTDRANAYFHGHKFRLVHHLAGAAVAGLSIGGTEQDVLDGNRSRFRKIEKQIEKDLRVAWKAGVKQALKLISP